MSKPEDYNINLDIKYPHLEVIDIPALADACKEQWQNFTLTQVNDSVVRIGVVEGDFHWHKHDHDDEFFYVISGKLYIDLEGKTLELEQGQGATITRGVMHRPRAPQRTVMLMVETSNIQPTGD